MYTEHNFDCNVIWCYSDRTSVPSQVLANVLQRKFRFYEGVSAEIQKAGGRTCLILRDDLLNDDYYKQLCDFFTKRSLKEVLA